jgi:fibronectin-binding autotransporter adhesin
MRTYSARRLCFSGPTAKTPVGRLIARLLRTTVLMVLLAAARPAAADSGPRYDFTPIQSDDFGYAWGYVDTSGGTNTFNWSGPPGAGWPDHAGDAAFITQPTLGLTIKLYTDNDFPDGNPAPSDFTVGSLTLDAGLNGYYNITNINSHSLNYLIFDNSLNVAQLNVALDDAGNDVISCGVNIVSVLNVTGTKLAITGPVIGGQLLVNMADLTLSGINTQSSTVLHSGSLNVAADANLGIVNGPLEFQGGSLNLAAGFTTARTLRVDNEGGTVAIPAGETLKFAGPVNSATGTLAVTQGGTLELATTNAFTGGLSINSSTLLVSSDAALNGTSGALALNNSAFKTAASFSTSRHVSLGASSTTFDIGSDLGGATQVTITGPIDGTGNLVKSNYSELVLSGALSYSGATEVKDGTLTIIGTMLPSHIVDVGDANLNFYAGSTTAVGANYNNSAGGTDGNLRGGQIVFFPGSVPGNATLNNYGGVAVANAQGARLLFFPGVTLNQTVIVNLGATLFSASSGGQTVFGDGSSAGTAFISNTGGDDETNGRPAPGGETDFEGNSTAGSAIINSSGLGPSGFSLGFVGITRFTETSSGGTSSARITSIDGGLSEFLDSATAGAATVFAGRGGETYFNGTGFFHDANAGTAKLFTLAGGDTYFTGQSRAGHAIVITLNSASGGDFIFTGAVGGPITEFHAQASADHATFTTGSSTTDNTSAMVLFYDSATAGSGTFFTYGGVGNPGGISFGAAIQFHNSSTAASGNFANYGAVTDGGSGGEIDFYNTSTASDPLNPPNTPSATFANMGTTREGSGGLTQFHDNARAGTASFSNFGATAASSGNNSGGYTTFSNLFFTGYSSADHGTFFNYGSAFNTTPQTSGHTVFATGSRADHGTFYNYGSPTSAGVPGETDFFDGATADNGVFTNYPGAMSGAAGGLLLFDHGGPSAGSATISNLGGTIGGARGGATVFSAGASAGSASITTAGGSVAGALGGTTTFNTGSITAAALLTTSGGADASGGGLTQFIGAVTGGTTQVITNSGGTFDISQLTVPGLTVGSIEGGGRYQLGSKSLTFGSLGTNTLVSGQIVDGGIAGGAGGSIVKTGTGTTTLSGTNTYTGTTTVNGGALIVAGSIASSLTVNAGSTLNFADAVSTGSLTNDGSVLITAGATFTNNVTNNGTFKTTGATTSFAGTFTNNGVFHSDPSTQSFTDLIMGSGGALVGGLGDVFNISGNFTNNSTNSSVWDTHQSQISFNAVGTHQLTWPGTDQGRGNAGFINNFAVGNFVLPSGASLTTVGGGALYTRVLSLGNGLSQISSISGSGLNIHYNPGSPQNAYLNFQTYALPNGYTISPAAAPADVNAIWNGTTGNWTDGTKWSGAVSPLNPSTSVTLYDATINSGIVTLNQNIGYIQKLNLGSGGTLTGAAGVTPWDTFSWGTVGNNAAATISGSAIVNANGDINIVGDSARNLDNATINNHAGYIATWATGNSDINFSNNAAFNNFGSFIVQNNRSLGHTAGTGTFNNTGTFTKNTGAGITNIGSTSFVFNNPGTINVQTGTLEFDGPLLGPTSGAISIASTGTLVIADGASVFGGSIASSGPLNIGDAVGAANSASLQLQADNQINNTSILTINSDGLLNLNGVSANAGALVINGGNVSIGSGTLIPSSLTMTAGTISSSGNGKVQLTSGVTAISNAAGNTAAISAQVDLNGATRTFTVNHAAGVTDLLISGNISNGGLIKTGLGTMSLSGNNTYAGGTILSQGTLNINTPTAIGPGAYTINGASTMNNTSGAPVTLATNNAQVWTSSFTFTGSQSLNFGTGPVTLNVNSTVTANGNTLTVGVISNGTGNSLTKAGAGILQLFGGAAYTGTTSVNAGTLVVSSGPFASTATAVAPAATMNFISAANAGSGTFTNNSSVSSAVSGGLIQFSDNATTAGNGAYTNNGVTIQDQHSNLSGNGAQMVFNSGTTAGNATIVNTGSSYRFGGATGGQIVFNSGSSAGNSMITTQGGRDPFAGGAAAGATTMFSGDSSAGNSTLISTGGILGGVSGYTEFKDTARAGTATITINNGISGNQGTFNDFFDHSTADSAHITVNGVSTLGFHGSATAGNATLLAAGSTTAFLAGTEIDFYETSTAGNAILTAASNQSQGLVIFREHSDAGQAKIISGTGNTASVGVTHFYGFSSAANATITTTGSAFTKFHESATAGSSNITNNGAIAGSAANGGELDFFDTSNAGNATIINSGTALSSDNGGLTTFSNGAKAGTATIINNGATITGGNTAGGYTYFNSGTDADHAIIITNGSGVASSSGTSGGHTIFQAGSIADLASLTINGGPNSAGKPGEVDFFNGASAGSAAFTTTPGLLNGAAGGLVNFTNDFGVAGPTAANGTFINNGAAVNGALGGRTNFSNSSTAAGANITANGATAAGAGSGQVIFNANTSAGSANLTANGGTIPGAAGGFIGLFGNPDPATSTFTANGGTNGGSGGLIVFQSFGGQFIPASLTRIIANAGGTSDSSATIQPLSVGSIEGAGTFLLGSSTLIAGSLNTDTTVSGIIANGGNSGGAGGKFTKSGTGKLSLTGANTYTGATTINTGTLTTNLLSNGGSASGVGASSNAAANLVFNGGTFQYTGAATSTDRLFTLGTSGSTIDASGAGPVTFNNFGAVAYSGSGPRTLTLTGSNTGSNSLAAAVADGTGGATSLLKSGSGIWLLSNANSYTGLTTISAGTLRYGGGDDAQAYTLNPANPAGNQQVTNNSLGLDFNVNSSITITQFGIFDDSRNGLASSHKLYIYDRNTQAALTTLTFAAGSVGTLSSDGYRFLPLPVPLTLPVGNYSVVADFSSPDLNTNSFGATIGTTNTAGGVISYVGSSRFGAAGAYPATTDGGPAFRYGAGTFIFNSNVATRIPGDVIVNGVTAILDLGANQNGHVGTVTLDGGGSITGTGTSTLISRTSFQLKSGTVSAILGGAGIPLVKSTTGIVTMTAANTYTGNTTVSAGMLVLGNSLTQSSSLSIAAGAKLSMSLNGSHVLSTSSLSINSTGILDLGDNDAIVSYTGPSPLTTIRALLASGFNSGNWDGNGINSLAAHNDTTYHTALGYGERSDVAYNSLDGVTLPSSAVIVKYTYYGDSNLDGVVNAADFTRFLDGLASGGTTWSQGDYTYDGKVDLGNDFNLFLTSYLSKGGALGDLSSVIENNTEISVSQKAQLLSVVPEPSPALLIMLACWSISLLRPRQHTMRLLKM